ncbi:MAG: RidA family protein [Myxococcota bacterium]
MKGGAAGARRVWATAAVGLALGCAGPATDSARAPEFLRSEATAALDLPFSDAVRVGSTLYLSGQVGNRPGTPDLVAGGIRAEARQALANVQAILERNGSSLSRVVKCTVFLADIADWPAFNEVYVEFFPVDPPARSALGAAGLALGARVEVECIAVAAGPE